MSTSNPFVGNWSGKLSETPVVLEVFETNSLLNVTSRFGGLKENLAYLGSKGERHCFWRALDHACICLFLENSSLAMSYFEVGVLRKVLLSRA